MLRATLRNVFAHKVRLLLTGLSVVLGVGFLAGTLVFTDTLKATFNDLIGRTSANLSVVVRAQSDFSSTDIGASSDRALVPNSLVANVAAVPGVKQAVGEVQGIDLLVTRSRQSRAAQVAGAADTRGVVDACQLRQPRVRAGRRADRAGPGRHRQERGRRLPPARRRPRHGANARLRRSRRRSSASSPSAAAATLPVQS